MARPSGLRLDHNLLDLVERDLVVGAVVELGRARAGVGGHLLGFFQGALALQVAGNPRRPEAVATGFGAYVVSA